MENIIEESTRIKEMMPIYTGTLTAIVAITVGVISGWWNHMNMKASIKGMTSQQEKKRKYEKTEKAYENFNIWKKAYNIRTFDMISYYYKHISYEEMIATKKEQNSQDAGKALETVEMLIDLYLCEECSKKFKSVLSKRDEVSKNFHERNQSKNIYESFKRNLDELEDACNDFKKQLKKAITV